MWEFEEIKIFAATAAVIFPEPLPLVLTSPVSALYVHMTKLPNDSSQNVSPSLSDT